MRSLKSLSCCLAVALGHAAGAAESAAAEEQRSPAYAEGDIEEVVVTAPSVDPGRIQSLETMFEIYRARETGSMLYKQQKYSQALPHLLSAAKRGFKYAQARVGFIYQQGLDGVPQDPEAAIGWLGVAASGRTHPEMLNHFNNLWGRIPEEYRPGFQEVIDYYVATYGNRANRVGCDLSHRAGTYIKKLTCRFEDEAIYGNLPVNDGIQGSDIMSAGAPGTSVFGSGGGGSN